MEEAKFWVEDLFSLVDIGVAIPGWVVEGIVRPGMKLVSGGKEFEILRIEGMEGKEFDFIDKEICKGMVDRKEQAPGVILKGADKKELTDLGVYRGQTITFTA